MFATTERVARLFGRSRTSACCRAVEDAAPRPRAMCEELESRQLMSAASVVGSLIPANVIQLLDAAEATGLAIAPDRHGSGTNALALGDGRPFAFSFGADSYHLHRRQISGHWRMVPAPGLAIDIDTPTDLALAVARGFCPAV